MIRISEFLTELRRQGFAEPTVRSYEYSLRRLESYLEEQGIGDVRRVTGADISSFLAPFRFGRRWSRYCSDLAVHIGRYFDYLTRSGIRFTSPAEKPRSGAPVEGRFPVFRHSQMTIVLNSITGDDPISVRGRAMLELAYSAALRPRELRDLELPDIDRLAGVLFVRRSKEEKNRAVPVGQAALAFLDEYISHVRIRYQRTAVQQHVFISHRTGAGLTTKGVWWAIQEALRRSRQASMTPYSLRVSAATALLEGGMEIGYISRLLGHARIETTLHYLRVSESQLSQKLSRSHPRNGWSDREEFEQKGGRHEIPETVAGIH
jgi:site-specific recombinase XerD